MLKSLQERTRPLFLSAVGLLGLCAIASYLSFLYFKQSQGWVLHTHNVAAVVGSLEASLNRAARLRVSYMISGDDSDFTDYRVATKRIPEQMGELRRLIASNPLQVDRWQQLQSLTTERLELWEISMADKKAGKAMPLRDLLHESMDFASGSAALCEAMRSQETRFLDSRIHTARRGFFIATLIVISSFTVALLMLCLYYILLKREFQARAQAERGVRDGLVREAGLRHEGEPFRLFIDTVKDYAIFTLDSTGHVSSWNQGAQRLKGYATSEILGKHFSQFYPDEDMRRGKPAWELDVAAREGRVEDEGWRVRKDGSRFWADVVITATRNGSGQLIGFTKVTRDFTEKMRAQEELRRANNELAAEVAERKSTEERLARSERSLRELSRHLLRSQDEERRRIGRELHDSLGQYLAMLKINLDSLQAAGRLGPNGSAEEIDNCVHLAEDCLKEVRTISYLLYPPMLEEMGLKSAIPWYLDGFSKRSNIRVTFEADNSVARLVPEAELALFRVLQESLTNVHRHSGSSTAKVWLGLVNESVILEIKDRGKGIAVTHMQQAGEDWVGSLGVGLRGMNERIRQLGGKLEVSSNVAGTTVTASVPIAQHSRRTP